MSDKELIETTLGLLPSEWEIVQIRDVALLTMGQSPPSSTYNTNGDGLPFLQGKAEFGNTFPNPVKWCSKPLRIANSGSILISVRAPVGNVNVTENECCIGRGLASIEGKEAVDNWYLFYQLIHAKKRLEKQSTGSTFKSINKGVLQDFTFPLPPLSEQRAIAHVLTNVRQAIEVTERVIEAGRELKRSMMKHLFTYGPVPIYQADQVLLKETEIGEVPEAWEIVRLGDHSDIFVSTSSLSKAESFSTTSSEALNILYLKVSDLNHPSNSRLVNTSSIQIYIEDSALENIRVLTPGSIVFPKRGAAISTNKKRLLVKYALIDPNLIAVTPKENINQVYCYHWFEQFDLRSITDESTLPQLNKKDVEPILFPLPPMEEQNEITNCINSADRKVEVELIRKNALETLFNSLLHHLITGKLRVKY